jgi:hypothetical protein
VIGEIQGGWWPFLLMNLLVYVLLPRVLSFAWAEWSLGKALQRLFRQDAYIAGWWQRLSFEDVRQEAQAAPFNPSAGLRAPAAREASSPPGWQDEVWPDLDAIVAAGVWGPEQLQPYLDQLPPRLRALPQLATAQLAESAEPASYLLICKGWEPPTEMLADLCDATQAKGQQLFLWPVTLPGLKAQRAEQLLESWRLFVPRLPPNCHLLETRTDA